MTRMVALLCLVAFAFTVPVAAEAAPKKCKKGYVLKKVKNKKGKKVRKCVKRKRPGQGGTTTGGTTTGGETGTTTGGETGGGTTGGETGGGTTGGFPRPASETQGDQAWELIRPFFVNSRFTDCPGVGWPSCSVEHRYNHCAGGDRSGQQEYHRMTPTSGSDIHAYGTYHVTGAVSKPDGSWLVEYILESYGNTPLYHWEVGPDGTAALAYYFPNVQEDPDGPEITQGLRWQQPADCGDA